MKEVTAAIIVHNGKVLIAQRSDGQMAGFWEFPGGKVEPGETYEECLRREIKEELNIEVEVKDLFGESRYQYEFGEIKLIAYECRWTGGQLVLNDHRRIAWVRPGEMDRYQYLPADIPLVSRLQHQEISGDGLSGRGGLPFDIA